ncbi:sodium:proline symporter [Thalassobacillus devorans]|uniref:Sodium/proline symporter n=1 Tax=Thalassobacillus devorans TaxID=279813 RepID=A0ABQ1PSG7_9BACI|nr:sodium/proline symporter [Thalassobacillus devorans]NIK30556.1 sodium/proline symporter [Thalassobacillus devorans]GGD02026.1 sodium:proline symporter [Thalassobacillus devorans]
MNNIIIVEFILYCLVILGIGYYFSRTKLDHSAFLLGGKKLPGWALAFSERATGESAWLLLGYTGFVFATGLSGIWVAAGIALGIIFSWLFLAKKFMQERDKYNVLTLPDYLAARFGGQANLIRWFATILISSFLMFYLSAQVAGAGKMLFTTFGLNETLGVILATIVVIGLAFTGGFISVVWTDMIQSIMMLITLVALPIVALLYINTNDLSIPTALADAGSTHDAWFGGAAGFAIGLLFFNNFSWFFGFLGGQPQLSARFMALRSEKDVKTGRNVAILWTFLAYGGAFMIGVTAITIYSQGSFADTETVLPVMIMDLMPAWVAGILLSGILAAIITTADSQLMVVTSSISEDILHKALRLDLSEKQLLTASRVIIIVCGLIGMTIALVSDTLLYLIVGWAWAGVGGTLSPAIILTFVWKRYSGVGVIATIVSGFVFTVLWISTPLDSIITSRFTTFFIAAFFGIVFSLLFPNKKSQQA